MECWQLLLQGLLEAFLHQLPRLAAIGVGFFTVVVVGDLPPPKAREFFDWLAEADGRQAVDDAVWKDVYEVRGLLPSCSIAL